MSWILQFLIFLTVTVGSLQERGWNSVRHQVGRRSVRKAGSIGGSKILECEINYPNDIWVEHIITWRKQGIEVPIFIQFNGYPPHIDAGYQNRVRLVEQASIELSDIRTTDEGWFECSIVFLDGDDETNTNGTWIYLSVNSPPVLGQVSPSFLIQKEGDTVDMFCQATATPEPSLTWLKDGKELKDTDRVTISGNRVQVKALVREDGGVYTCSFKNVVGQVAHIIKLVIEDPQSEGNAYIMVPPKNTTEPEGSRVKLNCQAEGYPNNITYRWFKNTMEVHKVQGLMKRAGVYADGSFVINSVVKWDTGWYKCRPTNGLAPPPEAQAFLNVTYLPRVLSMPVRLYLPHGMMGRIECPVDGNPGAHFVTWTKDDRSIDFQTTTRLSMSKLGTLVIKAVMAKDEGRYRCTPYSPMGSGQTSTPVQVLVRDPPHFRVRPDPIYQREVAKKVVMPCIAEGDPQPTITWRKSDGTFPSTTKTLRDNGNLTIANLGKEDQGTYECVATNVVTSVITTALLIIEVTTPHAPYNLTIDTTQHSAKISWLPAYDEGYPQHYVLWYKSQDGGHRDKWKTLRVVPDQATSIQIYQLLPDTLYQFTILSRNRLGDGLFSQVMQAKTKGLDIFRDSSSGAHDMRPNTTPYPRGGGRRPYGVSTTPGPVGPAPGPPRNVTVLQQKNALKISWMPPLNKTIPVSHYIIEYRTVGQWVPLGHEIVDKTYYLWTTVSRGAVYHFRIFSFHGRASSNSTPVVTHETGDPMQQGVRISDGMIGGIVGGLLFIFVAILLAVLAVKIFNKRKQRAKEMRYGTKPA